jgi:hypothetical protein
MSPIPQKDYGLIMCRFVIPNRRLKVKTLETFTQYAQLRPGDYAAIVGFMPPRAAWSYLKRLRKRRYLRRGRDWRDRIVYSISRKGAKWLLWWDRTYGKGKA